LITALFGAISIFLIVSLTQPRTMLCRERGAKWKKVKMLRAIVAVLLILWLLGFVLHIGGGVIHVLAVIAAAVLVYDLVTGKRVGS
jgi:uncharacterized protein DUF5670